MKKALQSSQPKGEASAKSRSARYERQRTRIVDAAVSLVNEKGVFGMTLQQVAQALDLTTTSVTYYYRYKEQLAAAVFEDTIERLAEMVREAGTEATPFERVTRYVELYFAQFIRSVRGQERPLAVLSELRTLEDATKAQLIRRYQDVFRSLRGFFGNADTIERHRLFSARAQMLNEALFWSSMWLRHYPAGDLHNVRRRLLDILENGISAPQAKWELSIVEPDIGIPDDPKRDFLRVATRLINNIGYKGASIDRITSEIRVTKGSFYHHLEAKDDLILECYREDYLRLGRLQRRVEASGGTTVSRLASGIASALALQFNGVHPLLRTTALQAMPEAVRQGAIDRFDRIARWLCGILVDGMADGSIRIIDPLIAGNVIISTINSAYDLRGWAGKQDFEDAIAIYAGTILTGIID